VGPPRERARRRVKSMGGDPVSVNFYWESRGEARHGIQCLGSRHQNWFVSVLFDLWL